MLAAAAAERGERKEEEQDEVGMVEARKWWAVVL
jgi:hypothetical protein